MCIYQQLPTVFLENLENNSLFLPYFMDLAFLFYQFQIAFCLSYLTVSEPLLGSCDGPVPNQPFCWGRGELPAASRNQNGNWRSPVQNINLFFLLTLLQEHLLEEDGSRGCFNPRSYDLTGVKIIPQEQIKKNQSM
jgi:hypothetical protein